MGRLLVLGLLLLGCDRSAPQPPVPADLPSPPAPREQGAVLTQPPTGGTQVLSGDTPVWPPSGPGCEALIRCCDEAAKQQSAAMLMCQLAVTTKGCTGARADLLSFLSESGVAAPPACSD